MDDLTGFVEAYSREAVILVRANNGWKHKRGGSIYCSSFPENLQKY